MPESSRRSWLPGRSLAAPKKPKRKSAAPSQVQVCAKASA
jgi:hypothetical protein